jgi:transcription factor Dp
MNVSESKRAKPAQDEAAQKDDDAEFDEGDDDVSDGGIAVAGSEKGRKRRFNVPGLKETSFEVLQLMRKKGVSSYLELVQTIKERFMSRESTPDEIETLKKRVSDVVGVLIAMRLVKKLDNKMLKYEGDPSAEGSRYGKTGTSAGQQLVSPDELPDDPEQLSILVQDKREQLVRLFVHHLLVDALIQRNEGNPDIPDENKISLPFVVVSASEEASCEVEMGEHSMVLSFDREFEVRDDVEILVKMGLLNDISADKISEIVPAELFAYLPPVLRNKVMDSAAS